MSIQEQLFSLQDLSFREFHRKLCPTVDPDRIIGVRTPMLRHLAKQIVKSGEAEAFLKQLPHRYYEENQLHAFIISEMKDYATAIEEVACFLPFVDNWATCDQLRPKSFRKCRSQLLEWIPVWLASSQSYTIRFGIEMLMVHYLEEDFRDEYLLWVSRIESEEYYVKMMQAWYFAEVLTKQYEAALLHLMENRLPQWVHNKAIQKARESYRITQERKDFLNTLKRK